MIHSAYELVVRRSRADACRGKFRSGTGGKERTAGEYRALLERAGFRLTDERNAGFYDCFVCRKSSEHELSPSMATP